ncbi:signal peptide peptidase SppA [Nitrosomonas sp. HPC101]|uniref:signal peptide peptidase SppA n=1 Tax=Nitrosomonas sp. HPC101 TaxID=1658667 RepID=UPI00136B2854|nr:signal peptide peptidase SppA [Nitrosomonas sp. HPC101]MXS85299.1 signal peptide peptidase SppA [Nitrosomonas sp. HPC101]
MQLSDIITAPWAIIPEKLLEIQAVYATHVRGEKVDIAAVEARLGKSLERDNQGYVIRDGVAVILIHGVIAKRMNLMMEISGGASSQLAERDIRSALDDAGVRSILLHIDSPGGTVDGTETLAELIHEASKIKPVVAFADGLMASAAYWIGSAATEVIAASATTQIGSIGVVTSHTDISKAQDAAGIKTTEISAGKYKRIASHYAPLSAEGAEMLQSQVDQLYTIFVDAVAVNRGVLPETVLEDMADGRVFLAKQAKKRNMIDRVASLETTLSHMATGAWPMKNTEQTAAPVPAQPQVAAAEAVRMDIDTLKQDYPEIVTALMQEGADAERARIQGCEGACLPGHEPLVASMKFDGKSTGQDVAMAIIQAEKKIRADHLTDFRANAPQPVPHAPVPAVEVAAADNSSLPLADRAKAEWDASESVRNEFKRFDTYLAYRQVEENTKTH